MALASRRDLVDVHAAGLSTDGIGYATSQCLWTKGFCVLEGVLQDHDLGAVLFEVAALDEEGRLVQPPTMFVDGLLGSQGSSRMCDLGLPDGSDPHRVGGDRIWHLDYEMTELGMSVVPHLGLVVKSRTGGIVHESGMPEDEGPELSEDVCSKWLNIFTHQQLMLVFCLGPFAGSLELQPFDESCNSTEIQVRPGTLVILRADLLQHRFSAAKQTYCLSCFFQKDLRGSMKWCWIEGV
mmetsp:Transcript_88300/g.283232  ORF Transcript_88300/g.283232 Transcript_88300/m.283232 type:complete len:238 (+) Transcript_88300:112-825(+)